MYSNEKKIDDFRNALSMVIDEYPCDINDIMPVNSLEHSDNDVEETYAFLDNLSSGHKVVLSILAFCSSSLSEKSILFIDEPENHLHPPLLLKLMHALSDLLSKRNSVAVLSTHSPIVLQVVPKKCVWKLDRIDGNTIVKRPTIETYGASIGMLSEEVFGYRSIKSGYYADLMDKAQKHKTFEDALESFEGEIGEEARSLLRIYYYQKGIRGGETT